MNGLSNLFLFVIYFCLPSLALIRPTLVHYSLESVPQILTSLTLAHSHHYFLYSGKTNMDFPFILSL